MDVANENLLGNNSHTPSESVTPSGSLPLHSYSVSSHSLRQKLLHQQQRLEASATATANTAATAAAERRTSSSSSQAKMANGNDENQGAAAAAALSSASGAEPTDSRSHASQLRPRGKDSSKQGQGWLKTQMHKFKSIELENKGSVARDHLALERTFLAWLRTSLAFASIGVAVTQLFRLNSTISPDQAAAQGKGGENLKHMGRPLGATFLGISIVVLIMGMHRYFESQTWLLKGKFPASRGSILLLTMIAALLIICSLVIVLVVKPSS